MGSELVGSPREEAVNNKIKPLMSTGGAHSLRKPLSYLILVMTNGWKPRGHATRDLDFGPSVRHYTRDFLFNSENCERLYTVVSFTGVVRQNSIRALNQQLANFPQAVLLL